MNELFLWQSKYETGNEYIDKQHKYLFDLANKISVTDSMEVLHSNVSFLYKYAQTHFDDEEKLMVESHYPLLTEHQTLHNNLLKTLLGYVDVNFEDRAAVSDFKDFVFEWVINHILYFDMNFVDFIHGKKIENPFD